MGCSWQEQTAGARFTARSTGCGCPYPARQGGLGEATGRPKKMQATSVIDHKWPYNENVSTPPFDRLRVVSVVERQSWGAPGLRPPALAV